MSNELPAPLVQRDVNVTEFPWMPLDVRRLLTSETWIKAADDGKLGHALICLWCEAWQQVPAGSLPNNDLILARLAMCSRNTWEQIKTKALDGFVLCSDDRLYHPVVIEKVMNAWNQKLARKLRTKAATEERKRKAEKKKSRRNV